jgi:hypothetical protein
VKFFLRAVLLVLVLVLLTCTVFVNVAMAQLHWWTVLTAVDAMFAVYGAGVAYHVRKDREEYRL